jgi:hypothetical protein
VYLRENTVTRKFSVSSSEEVGELQTTTTVNDVFSSAVRVEDRKGRQVNSLGRYQKIRSIQSTN